MADPKHPGDEAERCIIEAPPGFDTAGSRDCSDEILPEGEQISDEDRAALEEEREEQDLPFDWSRARAGAPPGFDDPGP